MSGIDLVYLLVVGAGVYLAYSSGILDQAGQALVNATQQKQQQGYAKHHRHKEIVVPVVVQPRMRLTIV